ncbi:MAG TPA: type II CAAX endopeptidase family protein [Beutenbergiaceae bacterium]|nr:type II CAAX endopeptidase family protein [Beutenbergiaceae bacterium]
MKSRLLRHPVIAFYGLLLLLTWPVMLVAGDSTLTYVVVAVLGPSTCALIVTGVTGGRAAVLSLLKRLTIRRVPVWVWLYAVMGNGLLITAPAVIVVLLGQPGGLDAHWEAWAVTLAVNLVLLLIVPGMVEEIGWRGFGLPLVQERSGPIVASVVIGVLWAVWHYPLWIAQNDGVTPALIWATIGVVGASFAYTWLHNASFGSVLPAIVLHAGENAWRGNALRLLTGDEHDHAFIAAQVAAAVIALVLVIATRGRLGMVDRGSGDGRPRRLRP